jgi:hypothetical protein
VLLNSLFANILRLRGRRQLSQLLQFPLIAAAEDRETAPGFGIEILVVLFDPYRVMLPMLRGESKRYDQSVVDYLKANDFNYFDMNEVHRRDFASFKVGINDYRKRYFIGHYNPAGNHFFAYSIKDQIIKMLDPKPVTYREVDANTIHFRGYLENYQEKPAAK